MYTRIEVRFLFYNIAVMIFIFRFQIIFDDNEYLIGISGRVGSFGDNTVITSVTFQTNIRTYGEYGTNPGTDFSFGVTRGKFSGFYGKCGSSVDSLGVILQA